MPQILLLLVLRKIPTLRALVLIAQLPHSDNTKFRTTIEIGHKLAAALDKSEPERAAYLDQVFGFLAIGQRAVGERSRVGSALIGLLRVMVFPSQRQSPVR